MGVTFYYSDTHGEGVPEKVLDLGNYFHEKFSDEVNVVDAGDRTSNFYDQIPSSQKNAIISMKFEQSRILDKIIGQYQNIKYFYLNGNHDPEDLKNATCIKDNLQKIDGITHLGVENHGEYPFPGRSDISKVCEMVEKADVVVSHSPTLNDGYKCVESSEELEKKIREHEPDLFYGHDHGNEFRKYGEKGHISRISVTKEIDNPCLTVRVNDEKGDDFYKLSLNSLNDMVNWINPDKEYKSTEEIFQTKIEQVEKIENYIQENYPDFVNKRNNINEEMKKAQTESGAKNYDEFMEYIVKNRPELKEDLEDMNQTNIRLSKEALENLNVNNDFDEEFQKAA
ncbi:MAG: hypothetical protein ACOCP8_08765 [archaeon]